MSSKKILLGVTGSIAVYKAAYLVRELVKSDFDVKVVMTDGAKEFVTPLTFSTLSKNPVYTDFFKKDTGEWHNHIDLANWADILLIAPATALSISKFANGICDNLLCAAYLSAKCPVYIAPSMDNEMYHHPSTQKNLKTLESFGNIIIYPEFGELASGLTGDGRMQDPNNILKIITNHFEAARSIKNHGNKKKILITAGPTIEPIDPVRFIGNHSSGKMGYAIAHEFANNGHQVILISGPVALKTSHPNIKVINVTSASEMYDVTVLNFKQADIAICAAAVADYSPKTVSSKKIKKENGSLSLQLIKTKDILQKLGEVKTKKQLLIGFSLETDNEIENAKSKLKGKNLDFIILNSLNDKGAGFKHDTNKITIIDKNNKVEQFELKNKSEAAKDIFNKTLEFCR